MSFLFKWLEHLLLEQKEMRLVGSHWGSYHSCPEEKIAGIPGRTPAASNLYISSPPKTIFKKSVHLKDLTVVPMVFLEIQDNFLRRANQLISYPSSIPGRHLAKVSLDPCAGISFANCCQVPVSLLWIHSSFRAESWGGCQLLCPCVQ